MAHGLARRLRSNQTDAEKCLWAYLRRRRSSGSHFRRPVPIGAYIVDFCSHGECLVIEVDGGQHNSYADLSRDAIRTKWLESRGYRVLRFWNNEVLENLEGVVVTIENELSPTRGAARRTLPARGRVYQRVQPTDV